MTRLPTSYQDTITQLIAQGKLSVIPPNPASNHMAVCIAADVKDIFYPLDVHQLVKDSPLARTWDLGEHTIMVNVTQLASKVGGQHKLEELTSDAPRIAPTDEGKQRFAIMSKSTAHR